MKKEKKKVGNAAAAAAATVVAGAAAVTMGNTSVDNEGSAEDNDSVGNDTDVAEPQEMMVDGGTLPEVEITGETPVMDGGVLADVVVNGNRAEPVVAMAESDVQMAQEEAVPVAEVVETVHEEAVAVAEPVEDVIAEPDFGEEFDDDSSTLASAEVTPGTMAEELLHKAEEKLSDLFIGGEHTDEQDFQNMADASDFMYQD